MAAGKQETVSLAAGEQATILCEGAVAFTLGVGAVEVDGATLQPEVTYRMRLGKQRHCTLYSLNGGSFMVVGAAHFSIVKAASRLPGLNSITKSAVRQQQSSSRIVVLGAARSGKSTVARTLLQQILRANVGVTDSRFVYVEGDIAAGSVCAAGTMAAAIAEPPSLPIESPFLDAVPMCFWAGCTRATSEQAGHVLHVFSQTLGAAEWLLRHGEHRVRHLVVDAPNIPDGADPRAFLRQVVLAARPTHVVTLGDDGEFDWINEELSHAGTTAVASHERPFPAPELRGAVVTENDRSFAEYFCGPPSTQLDSAAVVAKLSDFTLARVSTVDGKPSATQAKALDLKPGMILGVVHAQTLEEVPFANLAGLVLVKAVDASQDELTIYTPDIENVPRGFLVVGDNSMHCRPQVVAPFSI